MSYKMMWETMKEALECRVDEEAENEYKYIRLSTLLELMNEQEEAAGGKKWYNGEIGYDIPITIVGVIGALLMGAGSTEAGSAHGRSSDNAGRRR